MVGSDENPHTEIIGTDLSPTQPTWVPPNVKFEVDDCEAPWTFPQKFDVVHCRNLAASVEQWPQLISQAYRFAEPGGWAEFKDYDLSPYSDDGSLEESKSLLLRNKIDFEVREMFDS
ncbi:MAG: hypothetical protein Q9188_004693 [Gyalolechia gomerana]